MEKYLLRIIAALIAFMVVAFNKPIPERKKQSENSETYYYYFIGVHGQESDTSKWVQLASLDDYEEYECLLGMSRACKIKNTTNYNGHPTLVPLTFAGFPNPTIAPNIAVVNRAH